MSISKRRSSSVKRYLVLRTPCSDISHSIRWAMYCRTAGKRTYKQHERRFLRNPYRAQQRGDEAAERVGGAGRTHERDGGEKTQHCRQNGGKGVQPFSRALYHRRVDIDTSAHSEDARQNQYDRRNKSKSRAHFHRRLSTEAAERPASSDSADTAQTAGRMSNGVLEPAAARRAAAVVGIS